MSLALIERARGHADRIALIAPEGAFTYRDLLDASSAFAGILLDGRTDLREARVCTLVPPGFDHVAVQWGVWRAGGVDVPLALTHPPAELAYVLADAEPAAVVVAPELADRVADAARARGVRLLSSEEIAGGVGTAEGALPSPAPERGALMLYTSGTTGRPKGVLLTHANLTAQVEALVEAWGWTRDDHILLTLPLHHVHGIVNVLTCALWSGACCQVLPHFDPVEVWERMARGDLTLYMAVPTLYRRLIDAWESADAATRARWSDGARALRLMVSGSAALPVPTTQRWEEITSQRLLERYGMTEIGMALSNPLDGERRAGHVGHPLPRVEARLVGEDGDRVADGTPGEIQVRSPGVFREYWRRPEETGAAFTADGWFRSGDLAVVEDGAWRILGRISQDILKTGGEKVSALEIEDALRGHPDVLDCAVVGLPDPEWGERVCAAVVARGNRALDPEALRIWASERLAPAKVPKEVRVVAALPRNAMGKVTKPAVRTLLTRPL
jgi:malonyl-CoA/methylmalonyl-CoA synthetase